MIYNTVDAADLGHWQLVPDIQNVDICGGSGNDTILGGEGTEQLFGGAGNDLIRGSVGDDLLDGGPGNDSLYGGIGKQTLMGGLANDTIRGGCGSQLLLGGVGNDFIHGGAGPQTLMGGAGNGIPVGGTGEQLLDGGDGNDIPRAGSGNETLSGGPGRDPFVFTTASGHAIITDPQPGQDIVEITFGFRSLTLNQPKDLLPHILASPSGNAVLTVGGNVQLSKGPSLSQRMDSPLAFEVTVGNVDCVLNQRTIHRRPFRRPSGPYVVHECRGSFSFSRRIRRISGIKGMVLTIRPGRLCTPRQG